MTRLELEALDQEFLFDWLPKQKNNPRGDTLAQLEEDHRVVFAWFATDKEMTAEEFLEWAKECPSRIESKITAAKLKVLLDDPEF